MAGYENNAEGVFGLLAQPEKVVPTFNGFFEKMETKSLRKWVIHQTQIASSLTFSNETKERSAHHLIL